MPKGTLAEEANRKIAQLQFMLTKSPEIVGETIVCGIKRRKAQVLIGSDAKMASALERLLPVSYWKLIRTLTKS